MRRETWKQNERDIAKWLGGQRIPINGRAGPDIEAHWLVAEVKSRSHVPAYLRDWLAQARTGAPVDKLPIVVIHQAGAPHREDLVLLSLDDFCDWFLETGASEAREVHGHGQEE